VHAIQAAIIPGVCFTPHADQYSFCGGAGFLTVLNPEGNATLWSTFLGEYPHLYLRSVISPEGAPAPHPLFFAGGGGVKGYVVSGPAPFPQPIPNIASLVTVDEYGEHET
jgi:hypothetical protein